MSTPTLLRDLAHARTGDKGNRLTLSVVAYDIRDFARLERAVTAERVRAHYGEFFTAENEARNGQHGIDHRVDHQVDHRVDGLDDRLVDRYVLPQLGALNFVLHGALGGGVTRSLALDAHGKCLGQAILSLEV